MMRTLTYPNFYPTKALLSIYNSPTHPLLPPNHPQHNTITSLCCIIHHSLYTPLFNNMRFGKEDFGLNLSLSFPHNNNLVKPSSDQCSEACGVGETRPFLLQGIIDVNRLPSEADCEEEAGVSSPNSTISSVISGKRNSERDHSGDEHDMDRACSSRGLISDEEDNETSRKKLRLSKDQSAVLEESFKEHNTLNPKQKLALAKQLGLRPRQVEVWFQNRRARTKLKQTEVDCEFLKRCCENLTEENRRLQKEVQELRALKLSPQFYMQMTPPTTLTMCPSCERLADRPIPIGPWAAPPPISALHHHHHHHHHPIPRS